MASIVSDDDVRSGDPRIEGTRITVLDVKRRIIDDGDDPHVVAGEYDVALADLFRALTYYYDNRREFEEIERELRDTRTEGELRTRELVAEVESDDGETAEEAD